VKFPFDPNEGPIYVEAEVSGPTGRSDLRLLLDPGATITLIDPDRLIGVGFYSSTAVAMSSIGLKLP
jgi:hypothetical protein